MNSTFPKQCVGRAERLARLVLPAILCLLAFRPLCARAQSSPSPAREVNWQAMGPAPCIWPTDESALHAGAKIQALRANGFGCYVALLWGEGRKNIEGRQTMDLSGFEKMMPAFNSADISVWVALIPPSEGGNSEPFGSDYVRWMRALAKLSLKYPHLRGVNIDDFQSGISRKTFTPAYTCALYRAKQQINPKLQFAPTVYKLDRAFAGQFGGCIDGVWLWWTKLDTAAGLKSWLKQSRAAAGNRFPVYSGVYAHSTSWHQKSDPAPAELGQALEKACQYADGAVIWRLPLTGPPNPLLEEAQRFGAKGSSGLAGRCGAAKREPMRARHDPDPAAEAGVH
ncbi:MAG: hypothetical protein ACRD11_04870 [Terriglobia bacterium]